jgi:thymidylate kinase
MPLICFFGPDGSGKTTLAAALVKKLKRKDLKPIIAWIRGTHTLASLIARFISKFSIFKGFDNPYYRISIPSDMRRLWQLLEFTSALPVLLIKFILPSILGYTVIAERYMPDLLAWISTTTRDEDYLERLEARFMLALSAKANVRIYVTASEAELTKRRGGEVGQKFLCRQLKLYDRLAKIVKAYKIDTTDKSIKETLNDLLNLIQHYNSDIKYHITNQGNKL